jgi:tRNA (cmo5U34)-methyltransferase
MREAFDASAERYDQVRRQLIPCFDDFYRTAVELAPFAPDAPIRVLDLGAGTGLLAGFVLSAFPRARLTLVDVSEEMLARARDRFAGRGSQVTFAAMDYARAEIPGEHDLIVSALSIHHLEETDKVALFGRVWRALAPGGAFVNADQVLGRTPTANCRYVDTWLGRVKRAGITANDLAQMYERTRHDRLTDLETQLKWLREAGFVDVDCFFKWYWTQSGRSSALPPAG